MTKQLVMFCTAVMVTLLTLAGLWQFRIVVVYVLVSLALAATARPFTNNWAGRGFIMRAALILLYLISLICFGFLIFLVGKFAMGDIQQLTQTLSVRGSWSLPNWLDGSFLQKELVRLLPAPDKFFEAITGEQGQLVLPAVLAFTQGIGNVLSGILGVLLLSVYWSGNQIHFERLWLSLLPSEQRKQARDIWRTIELDLGAYIRSEIVQSMLAIFLLGLGYWLFGAPYPILLALIGSLAWLIPVVGGAFAVIPPLLLGLLTGVQSSLFLALYTLVVLIALQIWVEPRLFKRKWDNPILTLVILVAMADAFGLPGILVAPPLSAVCQILWSLLVSNRLASAAAVQISDLKERQTQLWADIKEINESPPLVNSSMERLTSLLEKAESVLPASLPVEPSDPLYPPQPIADGNGAAFFTKS